MWGGRPDRNYVSSEKGLPVVWDFKTRKNIKWAAELGKECMSTPVVAGGRVYIGTNNDKPRDPAIKGDRSVLMCFAEADGKFLWQAVHEKLPKEPNEDEGNFGLHSNPCVVGERVYYVSNRAELVCREAKDGKVVWSLDMRKDLGVSPHRASSSSPLVVGDLVYALTGHGKDWTANKVKNPDAPSFIAVHRETGQVVWKDKSPGDQILNGQWGSPAYGVVEGRPQIAFPGGDGWLYAFEPLTGTPIWKFDCKAHENASPHGRGKETTLVATPVYSGHRILISVGVGPGDGHDGEPGCLRAIDARKRGDVTKTAELWRHEGEKEFGVSISNVAVREDLVYAVELNGYLHCIELTTGKRVWRQDLLSGTWSSPLVVEGKVYVRTGDGDVRIFEEGREMKKPVKVDGLPDLENGSVVAANGVLYLAGKSTLYAVASGK